MFDENFNAENSLKKWASIFRVSGICLMALSFLSAFIMLCINARFLWWISLIVLASSGIMLLITTFYSSLIWGLGDMIGNTRRLASGTKLSTKQAIPKLPEL